MVAIAL